MSASPADAPTPMLSYDGRLGEFYRIFLINLLFTILSVGIWRFWASTRIRRYLWSHTSAFGERFEYGGTGSQLFVATLFASLALGALGFGVGALLPVPQWLGGLPLFAAAWMFILVLALGAPFSAQRYRLSHTVWCGIRGGMEGSMLKFGLRSLCYWLLKIVTFFIINPGVTLRLLEIRIRASSLGTQRFDAVLLSHDIYRRFLIAWAGSSLLFIALMTGVGIHAFHAMKAWHSTAEALGLDTNHFESDPRYHAISQSTVWWSIGAMFIFLGGAHLISSAYWAALYRHVAARTTLGGLSFTSSVSAAGLFRLRFGNLLILIVTLGLGWPVATHRTVRFLVARLHQRGVLDLADLRQSERPVSRFGEGMFQALDIGSGVL